MSWTRPQAQRARGEGDPCAQIAVLLHVGRSPAGTPSHGHTVQDRSSVWNARPRRQTASNTGPRRATHADRTGLLRARVKAAPTYIGPLACFFEIPGNVVMRVVVLRELPPAPVIDRRRTKKTVSAQSPAAVPIESWRGEPQGGPLGRRALARLSKVMNALVPGDGPPKRARVSEGRDAERGVRRPRVVRGRRWDREDRWRGASPRRRR